MEVFDDVPADEAGASVIKTRIGECKAAHQSNDQWIGKLKYLSIPHSFIRMVNLCENFWRFEQSIVASTRYEREC
jgi:hypothetical protein